MEGREGERRGGKGAGKGMDTPGAGPPPKNFGLEPPLATEKFRVRGADPLVT
jgi:hypothetical protein